MKHTLWIVVCLALATSAFAEEPPAKQQQGRLSQFGQGAGPRYDLAQDIYRLLDKDGSKAQSNAVAFDRRHEGARQAVVLRCALRVLKGGDGGAFVFLNTSEYGARGPAPFVKSWVEPNLKGTFAVGIDVHNPPSKEMFTPWGNYQDLPQREISLHWDGREIVKRVAPKEFRDGEFHDLEIRLEHVVGGAEVTVRLAEGLVYDHYFIPHLMPYESRLAIGAGTRQDASTEFDVREPRLDVGPKAATPRPPLRVEVFNHVLTDNSKTFYEAEVQLPPAGWAFGRVILTLDIHDAGKDWDEWDRNGEISIWDGERKLGIVPFITSYRTECHWKVDVTHFRPLLTGKRKLEVRAGTTFYKNRGYMMSVALDFHHGTPELEPFRVVPLWHGTAKYKSAENHFSDFFEPQTVAIPEEARDARIWTTTTGHSQIGEFTPSKRAVEFLPTKYAEAAQRFENTLWKTDVYLNPNRPQFGTWQFSRAGWAPGDVVHPWWIDLRDHMQAGQEAVFRYVPQPYDFTGAQRVPEEKQINQASHVVRSYLVLYRQPSALVAAPVLLVTNVAKDSNAAKNGMKTGDYLASYDGKLLNSVDDLRAAIQGAAGKEKIAVVIYRGAERVELELAPGRMGVNLANR
ncbi:MAG: peptide-N-glycosidase F-related protein [Planctomycetota bacterium]|nr:peptide-N-glycosidase F-related protein [Planctomycetota bacterium]